MTNDTNTANNNNNDDNSSNHDDEDRSNFYWTLSERALLIAGESETSRRAVSQRRALVADLPTSSEKEKRSRS